MKSKTVGNCLAAWLAINVSLTYGSADSIGQNGINSVRLPLTGEGIGIGQVELYRPGDPDIDADPSFYHSDVNPKDVFFRNPTNFIAVAGDGMISSADYIEWRDSFGDSVASGSGADGNGNGNGVVDTADYTLWRDASGMAASAAAVPEPTAITILFMVLVGSSKFFRKNGLGR